ncbi:hypothetical protein ASE74_13270 [Pedobacter sp. Leaf216]|uniref:DUF4142 domain-containing protein n=1 Tax=Pedobacter sp. Leaf216 TaxID=1735684 RepID=UPI0006F3F918|nr:DUF4142 domain-containing protein [Pedobacter sp. Leaf216]KQM78468.1 hypothetical protein ASE74_13270 [Pedobacter sp. Leaf216]
MNKIPLKKSSIILIALLGVYGCNVADKRSSLEKDSLSNDTPTVNRVGEVETFETTMEEEAADYLKAAGKNFTLQDSLLTVALSSKGNQKIKTYAKGARERIRFQKKTLEKFCNENKVLLDQKLNAEQIDSLHLLSKLPEASFNKLWVNRMSVLLKNNVDTYENARHARQQRVKDFVNQNLPAVNKEVEILNNFAQKGS